MANKRERITWDIFWNTSKYNNSTTATIKVSKYKTAFPITWLWFKNHLTFHSPVSTKQRRNAWGFLVYINKISSHPQDQDVITQVQSCVHVLQIQEVFSVRSPLCRMNEAQQRVLSWTTSIRRLCWVSPGISISLAYVILKGFKSVYQVSVLHTFKLWPHVNLIGFRGFAVARWSKPGHVETVRTTPKLVVVSSAIRRDYVLPLCRCVPS